MKMELARRFHGDQRVATELPRRPIAFLRLSSWRFSALSWRTHGALTAHTAHSLRIHCVHTACTALSRRSHCVHSAFTAILWRSHCAVGMLKRFIFTCVHVYT